MDIISFSKEEQETTVSYYRQDKIIEVYSSDMTVITKLKKITKDDNIEVLSRNELGNITSAKFKIDKRQLNNIFIKSRKDIPILSKYLSKYPFYNTP